jgi:hypothetical protein
MKEKELKYKEFAAILDGPSRRVHNISGKNGSG